MMPALRGLQQRDCSGISPDSLLSLEDSETLLEGEKVLSAQSHHKGTTTFQNIKASTCLFCRKMKLYPRGDVWCGENFLPIGADWVLLHWSWRQLSELTVA